MCVGLTSGCLMCRDKVNISTPLSFHVFHALLCPWAVTSDLHLMIIVHWMISGWAVWPQPGGLKVCHSHVHYGLWPGPGLSSRGWRWILEEHRGSGSSRDQERLCGLDTLLLWMESINGSLNNSKIAEFYANGASFTVLHYHSKVQGW